MSITFQALQELVQREGFQYYVHPTDSQLIFGILGMLGTHHVSITLFEDGTFLQMRSVDSFYCPADHPRLGEVQTVLSALNTQYRAIKFAREPQQGEIVAFADHWIMDGTLTQEQLNRLLGQFLSKLDVGSHRIRVVIDTGCDPGEQPMDELAREVLAGRPEISPEMRESLEKIAAGQSAAPSPEADIEEL
jgi:hypothetical protein